MPLYCTIGLYQFTDGLTKTPHIYVCMKHCIFGAFRVSVYKEKTFIGNSGGESNPRPPAY